MFHMPSLPVEHSIVHTNLIHSFSSTPYSISSITSSGLQFFESHAIVFAGEPALLGPHLVQVSALKEASHEGEAVLPDVGLPSEGVQDRVGAAADESQSRRHSTAGPPNVV